MKRFYIVFYIIFFSIVLNFVTIGYSAFNSDLVISGDAYIRSESSLRISAVSLLEKTGNSQEVYNSSFSNYNVNFSVFLPDSSSTITYQVTISNKTGKFFSPNKIDELVYSNRSILYSFSGFQEYGVYQNSEYKFTIKLSTDSVNQESNITLKFNLDTVDTNTKSYSFTGNVQKFDVNYSAKYKIELWGGQGGSFSDEYSGGRGGYTSGVVALNAPSNLYVYVGGEGNIFNGGGDSFDSTTYPGEHKKGGGATDVRLVGGEWNNFDSLKSRIMVAGGGGGGIYGNSWNAGAGGHAGGLIGLEGYNYLSDIIPPGRFGTGGGQTSAGYAYCNSNYGKGKFGIGGAGFGGGGGGYYGGGAAGGTVNNVYQCGAFGVGAGGSSFISGYSGCIAISLSSTENNIIQLDSPNHYSGYVFRDAVMISGDSSMPNKNGGGTTIGNSGNGYAKITLLPLN